MNRHWFAGILVAAAVSALSSCAASPSGAVVLDVDGRSNVAPWIAADGRFVAVAWAAYAGKDGDVFVAVSRDAGRTFEPPVRVNATPGEVRAGGEFPPRVALGRPSGAGTPEITVVWTAGGEATAIRSARSQDGGRTFGPPITLQADGVPGNRGWPSLAVDGSGKAHAVWLDHRGLAAEGAADHRGPHDGVAMAQKSGLFYAPAADDDSLEREVTRGVCYCCKTALVWVPEILTSFFRKF